MADGWKMRGEVLAIGTMIMVHMRHNVWKGWGKEERILGLIGCERPRMTAGLALVTV